MTKPIDPPEPDPAIGPLDEHGQQIWSAEEAAAIARLDEDPETWAALRRSRERVARGEWLTTEAMLAELDQRRRLRRGAA